MKRYVNLLRRVMTKLEVLAESNKPIDDIYEYLEELTDEANALLIEIENSGRLPK